MLILILCEISFLARSEGANANTLQIYNNEKWTLSAPTTWCRYQKRTTFRPIFEQYFFLLCFLLPCEQEANWWLSMIHWSPIRQKRESKWSFDDDSRIRMYHMVWIPLNCHHLGSYTIEFNKFSKKLQPITCSFFRKKKWTDIENELVMKKSMTADFMRFYHVKMIEQYKTIWRPSSSALSNT